MEKAESEGAFQARSAREFRRVIVESPYAGNVDLNLRYLRAALRDCLLRGEAPFASHALYTQPGVLRDHVPDERVLGIEAGLAWGVRADATVAYVDLGITAGMALGVAQAEEMGRPVEKRNLPGWPPPPRLTHRGGCHAPLNALSCPCDQPEVLPEDD